MSIDPHAGPRKSEDTLNETEAKALAAEDAENKAMIQTKPVEDDE